MLPQYCTSFRESDLIHIRKRKERSKWYTTYAEGNKNYRNSRIYLSLEALAIVINKSTRDTERLPQGQVLSNGAKARHIVNR
jgi:hypothetical protein